MSPSLDSDNHNIINLANNSVYHNKIKHIDVWYHFTHILLKDGVLSLEKIHTNQNPANMLTKVVTVEKLKTCSTYVSFQG